MATAAEILAETKPRMQASLSSDAYNGKWLHAKDKCVAIAAAPGGSSEHLISLQSCLGNPIAGAYLTAVGGPTNPQMTLGNEQFLTHSQIRMCIHTMRGAPAPDGVCKQCGKPHGRVRTADHALRCKLAPGRYPRHQKMTAALLSWASSTRRYFPPDTRFEMEPDMGRLPYSLNANKVAPTSVRKGKTGPKRADFAVHTQEGVMVADFTVVHPQSESAAAAAQGGATAGKAYDAKVKFYTDHFTFAEHQRENLWPLAIDSYGHMEKRSIDHLRKLVGMCAGRKTHLYSMLIGRLYQILSTALARGNAAMVSTYYQRDYPLAAPVAAQWGAGPGQ
jgi:hypothetical protein